ncbi:MAG: RNA polymerase sigma factor [candidate division KSB1 bacterium]|nr:RNA polymerase sigma factor [candidate division KSB1 bacterium]MDZ7305217.1 RNA polymerase sigma factor [candidate division KSB1 bacterium]MDZ7314328.1 RNA polymerase sigma factor [candidate division KSB1 bacterium]
MNATDDKKLVRQYQQGDPCAFDILFRRYYQYVYKVFLWKGVPSQDAEDCTQDIFLKLTETLLHFAGKSSFKTYLDRAITNTLINFYRKRRTKTGRLRVRLSELIEVELSQQVPREKIIAHSSGELFEAEALGEAIHNCMEKITNLTCRAVVSLWLDGFKLRQIAQLLALPLGTVSSHSARGRAKLRQCLEKQEVQ